MRAESAERSFLGVGWGGGIGMKAGRGELEGFRGKLPPPYFVKERGP